MKKMFALGVIVLISTFLLLINNLFDINLMGYALSNLLNSNELTSIEREWLEAKGSILYGADENSPPLMFVDNSTNQYKGFTIDYLNALSLELGIDIDKKSFIWKEALEKLEKGETDICDMFPSEERRKRYDFSDPIYSLRSVIVTLEDNVNIFHIPDLEGKKVAIPIGDYGVEYLSTRFDDIDFVMANNVNECIDYVISGVADAALGDEPVVYYYINNNIDNDNNALRILDEVLYESDVVLAVHKGNQVLINILNKSISKLNENKTVDNIQFKWFGFSNKLIKQNIDSEILLLIILVFFTIITLTVLSYFWNQSLTKQVDIRTEEILAGKEELRITFDSITNPLIVLDNNLKIVDMNKALLEFTDCKDYDLIGKDLSVIGKLDIYSAIKNIAEDTFIKQKKFTKEFKVKENIFEIKTFDFKKSGTKINKIIVMLDDITKDKMLEKKLLHSSKMESLGRLGAGVAHEIRNPLGVIRTYMYIINKKINSDNPTIKKSIENVFESVERINKIIENLLNFSRLFDDNQEEVNLRNFLKDTIELDMNLLINKNINYIIDCEESLYVKINRESMRHIVLNFLNNAVDAMPKGGILKITAKESQDNLEISFEDNGVGISDEMLQYIFEPFYTNKLSSQGTGLGLYVVYNEVKNQGGDIKVSSRLNEGTTFTVEIPMN